MSDYADKLLLIKEKKEKLLEEETRLIQKRKKDIGGLVERLGLLTASDELIAGLLSEAKEAIEKKLDDKVKEWEALGGRFLKSKSLKTAAGKLPA